MNNLQNPEENNYDLPQEIDLSKCTPAMRTYFEARAEFMKEWGSSINRIIGER